MENVRIRDRSYVPLANIIALIFAGAVIIIGLVESTYLFGLSFFDVLVASVVLLVFYLVLVLFLMRRTRVVSKTRVIEKPVIREIIREVPKKVERKAQKKHKFVASTETKIYHFASSRLARLIRAKNRVYSNSEASLKRQGYKPSEHVKDKKKRV